MNTTVSLKVWRATAEKMACNRTVAEQEETIRSQGNHGVMPVLRGGLLTALGAPKAKEHAQTCVIFGCYRPFTTPFLVRDSLRLLEVLHIDYTYLAEEYCCGAPLIAYSGEVGHAFQSKPAGHSGGSRPPWSERSDAVVYCVSTCCLVVLSMGSFSALILL